MCIQQLEEGRYEVENQYTRSVRRLGNPPAIQMIQEIFRIVPRKWRGVGEIPHSGLGLAEPYSEFDAEKRFDVHHVSREESTECISGLILRGVKKPYDCSVFGTRCTPEHPFGATMVSSEGACAAYFRYRRFDNPLSREGAHS
jgi:hydrogenase expression/formation protein HypD